MHEWALAEAILATATQISEKEQLKEVTEVTIRIGELQDVEKEILRFALGEIKSDLFRKAKFRFLKAKTELKCRVCGTTWQFKKEKLDRATAEAIHFVPEAAHSFVKCPKCGSPDFEIASGRGVLARQPKGSQITRMIDPRVNVINTRLAGVKRIVAVSSGKGGVGKSMVATALALTLKKEGCTVGLFDLDFTSPSTHIILNAPLTAPKEDKGIVPPDVNGLKYMSLVYFVGENPAPLRGVDVSNALIELLAVTQWGKLDFLVIDMPPGIGDIILDLLRLVSRVEFLIVTTSSLLAFETVKKQVALLCELKAPIIGVLENMKQTQNGNIEVATKKIGLKFLVEISFDPTVEAAIGDETKLLNTSIGRAVKRVVDRDILVKG